jgi:hypothetical protein
MSEKSNFLYTGVTYACFQSAGKTPSVIDALKIVVKHVMIAAGDLRIIDNEMESEPTAGVFLSVPIARRTSETAI